MSLSFEQLSDPITRDEALESLRTVLEDLGFQAKSWQSGSVQLTILYLGAEIFSKLSDMVAALLKGAFNSTSTATFLTKFSDSHYANTRQAAVTTQGTCKLTLAAGFGPYTIAVSQLIATDGTRTFRNTTGGTLSAGTTPLGLTFEAEVAGADSNVANNTITQLVTPLAGVTVNNPSPSGSTPWITRSGVDVETDAKLQTRNRTKWPTLSIEYPAQGYENVALEVANVTRAKVDDTNPRGPGTVDVYCAGATGTAASGDVTAVQAKLDARRAVTADVDAIAAPELLISFTGTIYVEAAKNTVAKQTEIQAALAAYINGLDIGGTILPPATSGAALRSEMIAALTGVDGVVSVSLTAPAADVAMTAFQVAKVNGTPPFTFTSV